MGKVKDKIIELEEAIPSEVSERFYPGEKSTWEQGYQAAWEFNTNNPYKVASKAWEDWWFGFIRAVDEIKEG